MRRPAHIQMGAVQGIAQVRCSELHVTLHRGATSTRALPELFWYASMNPPSAPIVAAIAADCLETLAVVPAGTKLSQSTGAGSAAD